MISYDKLWIKTINSGNGDCIHLRYIGLSGIPHNIIIDSGPSATSGEFRNLCNSILSVGEKLDILLLTHYDEDHIGGMLKVGDMGFQEIYFNAYEGNVESENLSATQNQRLFHSLSVEKLHTTVIAGDLIELDGAKMVIHAPQKEVLEKTQDIMMVADENLSYISDWDYSLDYLMNEAYPSGDNSLSNRASIIFSLEFNNYRMLFCGDAWERDIPGGTYDLLKLSHHGSIKNISDKLLSRIDTQQFLICANGVRHPNKQTIAKLLKKYGTIEIYSNYNWWMKGCIGTDDMKYIDNGQLTFKKI